MQTSYQSEIVSLYCDIVERQACMFAEQVDTAELPREVKDCIEASVSYQGEGGKGTLTVMTSREHTLELAENVLGLDPDDDEVVAGADDAFKELLNVAVGQVLTTLFGTEAVFDLSVPTLSHRDEIAWGEFLDVEETIGFLVDESPVLLKFESED